MNGVLFIPSDGFRPLVINAVERTLSMATDIVEAVRTNVGFEA